MVQSYLRQVMMRRYFHHSLEDPAEMKHAHATMFGKLLQSKVLVEVGEHIVLRLLDSGKVKLFQIGWYRINPVRITERSHHVIDEPEHEVVDLQMLSIGIF